MEIPLIGESIFFVFLVGIFLCFCVSACACHCVCLSVWLDMWLCAACNLLQFQTRPVKCRFLIKQCDTAAGVLCKEWEPPFQHKAVGLEKDFMEKKNQPISCLLKISQFWKFIDNFKYFFFSCNLLTSEDYNSPSVMSAIDKPVVCENELFPWCLFWILLSESSVFCTSRAPCSFFIHPENSTFSPRQKVCS